MQTICHPTDFSKSSEFAFVHALKIAISTKGALDILHAGARRTHWSDFPHVRETLVRWGLLGPDASPQAVAIDLGIDVQKIDVAGSDILKGIAKFVGENRPDLIVLSTEGREGLPRWIKPSVSERVARQASAATLFVPAGARGFVSRMDGRLTLNNVLVPVDHTPHPQIAVDAAGAFLRSLGIHDGWFEALHIGKADKRPIIEMPISGSDITLQQSVREGRPVDVIIDVANESDADLIVMATQGHDGFMDGIRGSTTEQVIRRAPCPVLAIPAS